jgi:MoaA/NifB/PqqE/SkfB family radical SAM enzyme
VRSICVRGAVRSSNRGFEVSAFFKRLKKRLLLTLQKDRFTTPPILTFFVTSRCNSHCRHCFNWRRLNTKEDLPLDRIISLSRSMGPVYNLIVSGGEPYLREDLADIIEAFYRNNKLEKLQISSNGLLPERVESMTLRILEKCPGVRLALHLSIDGPAELHDLLRGVAGGFDKVCETYDRLAPLKAGRPNLQIYPTATATNENIESLMELPGYIEVRMPHADGFVVGFMRGTPKERSVHLPSATKLRELDKKVGKCFSHKRSWKDRVLLRQLTSLRMRTLEQRRQLVPCVAGQLVGVLYENGDLANCEMLDRVATVGDMEFRRAWSSPEMRAQRNKIIAPGKCHCTHECFLTPSLLYNPFALARFTLETIVNR